MGICRTHVSVGRRPSPGWANGRRYCAISSLESVRKTAFGRICSTKKLSCRTIASPASERSALKNGRIFALSQWSQLCGRTTVGPVEAERRAPVMDDESDPLVHVQGLEEGVEIAAVLDETIRPGATVRQLVGVAHADQVLPPPHTPS